MYDEFAKWLDRILDENMPLPGGGDQLQYI